MRLIRWLLLLALVPAALVPLAACGDLGALAGIGNDDAPTNLTYQLIPSGVPSQPLAVLLTWDIPRSGAGTAFNVYGRVNGGDWQLRATTTSPTFDDAGAPDDQYYVATRDNDGNELGHSNTVTINRQSQLPAPQGLTSVSLNGAIQLSWADNALAQSNGSFDHYRVYSTTYDQTRGVCTTSWFLEGTTVSDAFVSGNLPNGVSRCFAVSAVTLDGHESQWSSERLDTPRFDARNVLVYNTATRADSSGFRFVTDSAQIHGSVVASNRLDLDFAVVRQADGSAWITPARSGATIVAYSTSAVSDLTAVDRAPASGFSASPLQALPGHAYVLRLQEADGIHFAGIRVAFVTADYVVFDWSYQSAAGNAELSRAP